MSDGFGCQCMARSAAECCCDHVDWRSEREVELETENASLKAELAEAKKDAERYRYFCEHLDDTDQTNPLHILLAAIGSRAPTKQELDAAIDDIIDAMKGK